MIPINLRYLHIEVYLECLAVRVAVAAAQNHRDLRQQGYTARQTIDGLTATFCLQAKHEFLHWDLDFDCFEKRLGLKGVRG